MNVLYTTNFTSLDQETRRNTAEEQRNDWNKKTSHKKTVAGLEWNFYTGTSAAQILFPPATCRTATGEEQVRCRPESDHAPPPPILPAQPSVKQNSVP
ncbi:hypothetical protein DPEC_G00334180 [Dallia pectoralis]|uniref:Uncharacterized protein n=1 Tax=Dallia pectoralis TaxID=75939 RepID=A0ACC2F6M0_DALPE|nr:hypothetical protein DPEC_G00334180 [Dallia pectoralis]